MITEGTTEDAVWGCTTCGMGHANELRPISRGICCHEIHDWRGFQAGEKQITLFCGPKGRCGTIFLLCPGLQRLSTGLPFANRLVSVALWLRNQKEIPGWNAHYSANNALRTLRTGQEHRIPLAFRLIRRRLYPAYYLPAMMEVR